MEEQTLGSEHRAVVVTLADYAALLRKTNRNAEALVMEARARSIRAQHEGPPQAVPHEPGAAPKP